MADNVRALLLLLLAPSLSLAANSVVLTWTAPAQNEDGTVIDQPITYKIYKGTTGQSNKPLLVGSVSALTYTDSASILSGQTYCYEATANTVKGESVHTNEVCKTLPATKPNQPGSLTATTLTAYYIIQQKDTPVMLAVGTVPAGTACDPNKAMLVGGDTFSVVPSTALVPYGSVKPVLVYAKCG